MSDKIVVTIDPDLEELIPTFLKNRNKDVVTLKTAAHESDFKTLLSVGHSLKGVGGGYGFGMITDIGADIEAAAKVQDLEAVKELIDGLDNYLNQVEVVYQ